MITGYQRRACAGTRADRERGSVTIWLATATFAMIILVGLVVDLSGQVHAQQHARDVAAQAARAGGQQLQAPTAVRGDAAVANPTNAAAAATAFLTAAGVSGHAWVQGGNTVIVTTTGSYPTKFLSIIGIDQLPVTGQAESRLIRTAAGQSR